MTIDKDEPADDILKRYSQVSGQELEDSKSFHDKVSVKSIGNKEIPYTQPMPTDLDGLVNDLNE